MHLSPFSRYSDFNRNKKHIFKSKGRPAPISKQAEVWQIHMTKNKKIRVIWRNLVEVKDLNVLVQEHKQKNQESIHTKPRMLL